ncbi:hypothetical protein FGO68_gene1339 [Halteria grandinella]|uniref:Uncharacterized protein n=1 Tax=Halteria grandinella TaxID=5974 RepID=A0A8J8SYM2_HALGN|nr:hypothetical protein FGO68_gene1339 [Halteria grandinella]
MTFEKKMQNMKIEWTWGDLNSQPPSHQLDALPLSYKSFLVNIENELIVNQVNKLFAQEDQLYILFNFSQNLLVNYSTVPTSIIDHDFPEQQYYNVRVIEMQSAEIFETGFIAQSVERCAQHNGREFTPL